jgi:hypothetical protein
MSPNTQQSTEPESTPSAGNSLTSTAANTSKQKSTDNLISTGSLKNVQSGFPERVYIVRAD